MTTFEANREGIWSKLVYTAVPLNPPLLEVMEGTKIKKHIVPWPSEYINTEAYSSHITVDNILAHVILSMHRQEVKTSVLFPEPKIWPKNHTSLQISAISTSKNIVDRLVKDTLGLWDCTEIYMHEDQKPKFQQGMPILYLKQFAYSSQFFEKYRLLRGCLSDIVELPNIEAPDTIDQTFRIYPTFIKQLPIGGDHAVWLTHRVRGKAGNIPVEAALVYVGGSRFLGLYGLMLYTPYGDGEFNKNFRSATGFVLRTDILHIGCTKQVTGNDIVGADSPDLYHSQQKLGLFGDYVVSADFNRDTVAKSNLRNYKLDLREITELAGFFMEAIKT